MVPRHIAHQDLRSQGQRPQGLYDGLVGRRHGGRRNAQCVGHADRPVDERGVERLAVEAVQLQPARDAERVVGVETEELAGWLSGHGGDQCVVKFGEEGGAVKCWELA